MDWYLEALRKYAEFDGRARRQEFWTFQLFNLIIIVGLAFVDVATGIAAESDQFVLASIYSLVVLIPHLAVSVRRLHDTNRSGWFLLITLVPLIGVVIFLVFMAEEGQKGENEYGPDPMAARETTTTSSQSFRPPESPNRNSRTPREVVPPTHEVPRKSVDPNVERAVADFLQQRHPVHEESDAEEDAFRYTDLQCFYRGSDPRLEDIVSAGHTSAVILTSRGMDLLIVENRAVVHECNYPVGSIRLVEFDGAAWAASKDSFDVRNLKPGKRGGPTFVRLTADDPEGIVETFRVTIEFRNPYYAGLLVKHLRERFCPIDVAEHIRQHKEERERLAAEQQEREFQRQREETAKREAEAKREEAKRKTTQRCPDDNRTSIVAFWIVSTCLVAFFALIAINSPSRKDPKAEPSLPPSAVSAGNFAAWTIPIARRDDEQPKAGDSPRPGQDYYIVVQVRVPEHRTDYDIADLSGRVIGTDGYVQIIPAQAFTRNQHGHLTRAKTSQPLPVRNGVVQLLVRVPGAQEQVEDTIRIRSASSGEEQTLKLVYGAGDPTSTANHTHTTAKRVAPTVLSTAPSEVSSAPFRVRVFITDINQRESSFVIEASPELSRNAAARFRDLVESGYYDGGGFRVERFERFVRFVHRGPVPRLTAPRDETTQDPSRSSHLRGSVGFRVLAQPQRRTEFFINLLQNPHNNQVEYEMLGKVVTGMNVVGALTNFDKITAIAIE